MSNTQTVEDLGKLVKAKYPDAYSSLSDVEVGQKVKAKYPEYSQFSDMPSDKKNTPTLGEPKAPKFDIRNPLALLKYNLSLPAPSREQVSKQPVQDIDTGISYDVAMSGAPVALAHAGLRGLMSKGAESGASAAQSIADKIPKIHPVAKFLAKRIPGVGTALDVLEALKSQYGSDLNAVPKAGRDEIAFQLFKETHGKPPESASDKITAIREMREALKTKKPPLIPKEAPRRGPSTGVTKSAFDTPPEPPAPKPAGRGPSTGVTSERFGAPKSTLSPGARVSPQTQAPPGLEKVWDTLTPEEQQQMLKGGFRTQPRSTTEALSPKTTQQKIDAARYKEAGNEGLASRELDPGKVINAQAGAKNVALGTRFKNLGIKDEQVLKMTEPEYEQHRLAENVIRKQKGLPLIEKVRPGPGRRTFAELKADIVKTMKSLP